MTNLIYIWIENFKNIRGQEFNFNPAYHITFSKEEKKLSLNLSQTTSIPNFFGEDIVNVTAIIGKNGSGKSNLLEFIAECYAKSQGSWQKPFLLAIEKKDEIIIYKHSSITLEKVEKQFEKKVGIIEFEKGKLVDEKKISLDQTCVYYSNFFDGELKLFQIPDRDKQSKEYIDLSTNWKTFTASNFADFIGDEESKSKLNYRAIEVRKQLDFIVTRGGSNLIDFELPDYIEISVLTYLNSDFIIKRILEQQSKDYGEVPEMLREIDHKIDQEGIYNQIVCRIFFAKIYENLVKYIDGPSIANIRGLHEKIVKNNELNIDILFNIPFFNHSDQLFKFLNFLRTTLYKFEGENGNYLIPITEIKLIHDFFALYGNLNLDYNDPIWFDWKFKNSLNNGGLSSGQKAMLTFYSRLKEAWFEIGGNPSILLIDEAELGYHPEWQRQFLQKVVKIVPQIMIPSHPRKEIQIVITSHSPFLASDLPRENIIFLDQNEDGTCRVEPQIFQEKTFGANIHTLLADSFFLHKGLVGEFAKLKIQMIIDWINDEKADKSVQEEIRNLIDKIGEPIVKNRLLEAYYEKLGIDAELEKIELEIQRLQDRRDQLKNNQEDA